MRDQSKVIACARYQCMILVSIVVRCMLLTTNNDNQISNNKLEYDTSLIDMYVVIIDSILTLTLLFLQFDFSFFLLLLQDPDQYFSIFIAIVLHINVLRLVYLFLLRNVIILILLSVLCYFSVYPSFISLFYCFGLCYCSCCSHRHRHLLPPPHCHSTSCTHNLWYYFPYIC